MTETQDLLKRAEKIKTPAYIYDLKLVKTKFDLLSKNLPAKFEILFAVKANPNLKVNQFLAQIGAGADIASGGELKLASEAGYAAEMISFAGPGKTEDELRSAIESNIATINVESISELRLIDSISRTMGKQTDISVRVNPQEVLKRSGMRMGGGPKQFGVDEELLPEFFTELAKLNNVNFKGIHVFSGSQILDHNIILQSFENVIKIALKILDEHKLSSDIINFGGGFGIPYFKGEESLDIQSFGEGLKTIMQKHDISTKFPDTRFFVESGRYLVGDCGYYLTKVLYKKQSRSITYLVTDGGMNHHLAASGNLGSLIKKNYKIRIISKQNEPAEEKVNIVGPLCTPLDMLARNIELPRSEVGDIICIYNSGAYGFSASPLRFLGHDYPDEHIIE